MSTADYTFRLNNLHINSKRNNKDYVDHDFVLFTVTVGSKVFVAPACTPPNVGDIGLTKDGDNILFYDKGADPNWEIGPLTIQDTDIVNVIYFVNNLSYNDDGTNAANALKVTGDSLTFVAGIVALGIATGPTPPGIAAAIIAGVLGVVGVVLQGLGDIIGIFSGDHQDCDGPVVASLPTTLSGAELSSTVTTLVGENKFMMSVSNDNLTQSAPGGCWTPNTNVTWSILRDISNFLVFGGPGQEKLSAPEPLAASSSPQDWNGTWGDAKFIQNSHITCEISFTGNGVSGSTAQERISSYIGGIQHLIENAPGPALTLLGAGIRSPRTSGFALASTPQTPRAISAGFAPVMPVTARYAVYILEYLSIPPGNIMEKINTGNLVEIPMFVSTYNGNIYPPLFPAIPHDPTDIQLQETKATETSDEVLSTRHIISGSDKNVVTVGSNLGASEKAPTVPLPIAATLAVTENISLLLYAQRDSSGKIVDRRVRYLRVSNNGVETDVMLAPATSQPS